jgi:hypothetical protein
MTFRGKLGMACGGSIALLGLVSFILIWRNHDAQRNAAPATKTVAKLPTPRKEPVQPKVLSDRKTLPASASSEKSSPLNQTERDCSISGRVTDAHGDPIEGATVRPEMTSDPDTTSEASKGRLKDISARTDGAGRYLLEGLPSFPSYRLIVEHPDFIPAEVSGISVGPGQLAEGVDVKLTRGGTIEGRIADEGGSPLAGAKVSAKMFEGKEGAPPSSKMPFQGTADADGRYILMGLSAGRYVVGARAGDRQDGRNEDVEVAEETATEGIDFVLKRGNLVTGRAVDSLGKPVPAAYVVVEVGDRAAGGRADAEGRFEIRGLPEGKGRIKGMKEGFLDDWSDVTVPAQDVTFTLRQMAKIVGTIRAKGRDSFPKFQIIAITPDRRSRFVARSPDPSGRFEIDLREGTYLLRAMVPGFAWSESGPIAVKEGERKEDVVIDLVSGGAIRGVVLAKRTGTPIEGASISYRQAGDVALYEEDSSDRPSGDLYIYKDRNEYSSAKSDSNGLFALEGVNEGTVVLTASHESYAPAARKGIQVQAGTVQEVRIEMSQGGSLQGRAMHGGKPAGGAKITVLADAGSGAGAEDQFGRFTAADGDGKFALDRLPAGAYTVTVSFDREGWNALQRRTTISEGEVTRLDIGEAEGIRLLGRITRGREPLPRVNIAIGRPPDPAKPGGDLRALAIAGDLGDYSVEVPGPGTYFLVVEVEGLTGRQVGNVVQVPEGVAEFRFDVEIPTGEIAGNVVDADTGAPIGGAKVLAFSAGLSHRTGLLLHRASQSSAETDGEGRFHLKDLPSGNYTLLAAADGREGKRIEEVLVDGASEPHRCEIALRRGIEFQAKVTDPRGQPVDGATAFLRDSKREFVPLANPVISGQDGVLSFQGVIPGSYQLNVLHRSFAPARIDVRILQESVAPTVILQSGGSLGIQVIGEGGRPIAGAQVEVLDGQGLDIADEITFFKFGGLPPADSTTEEGKVTFEHLGSGAYRVAASKGVALSQEARVTIQEGQMAEVRLEIRE